MWVFLFELLGIFIYKLSCELRLRTSLLDYSKLLVFANYLVKLQMELIVVDGPFLCECLRSSVAATTTFSHLLNICLSICYSFSNVLFYNLSLQAENSIYAFFALPDVEVHPRTP